MKRHTDRPVPLVHHLEELRRRVLAVLVLVAAVFAACLFLPSFNGSFSLMLLRAAQERFLPAGAAPVYLSPLEPVSASFLAALTLSLLIGIPVLCWQLYAFAAPALAPRIRRMFGVLFWGALALLAAGIMFTSVLIIPITLDIFMEYGRAAGAEPMISLYQFTQFIFIMFLIFSLPFELPLIMAALMMTGIADPVWFRKQRRFIYLAIAVFSAVFTPDPTPFSMTLLTLVLWLLYEVGIWLGVLFSRKRV